MLAKVKSKTASTKKQKLAFKNGIVHIHSTFNNTIVTITDANGNAITWASAGSVGFKGARKGTPFAAQVTAETAVLNAIDVGLKNVNVLINGQGSGRDTALQAIEQNGLQISTIRDITPVPHNGCRPPKKRRV